MADIAAGLPELGRTYHGPNKTLDSTYGTDVGLEGRTARFDDYAPGQAAGVKVLRSNRQKTCMLVRNVTPSTLLEPKRSVQWATGYHGKRVAGHARLPDSEVAGIVDEHLPSTGVREHDLFWITVAGPSLVKISNAAGEAVIEEFQMLVSATAAASNHADSGRVDAIPDGSVDALNSFRHIGIALTGALTAVHTGNDLLADITLMPS
jgi:hypothetical protein